MNSVQQFLWFDLVFLWIIIIFFKQTLCLGLNLLFFSFHADEPQHDGCIPNLNIKAASLAHPRNSDPFEEMI